MNSKIEKELLKSLIKSINKNQNKTNIGIPFKIRLFMGVLLAILLTGWFYLYNRESITYYFEIGYRIEDILELLLPSSIKTFIPPFLIGCFLSLNVIFVHSRYIYLPILIKCIDKEKILIRISELENKTTNHL
ncbi:hypothetical protein [Orbus mooreae]|uniref:hypothetical protein n=1 Tax=Orbus mooreae TaxID=3074107 RepID=UPI00370D9192